MTLKNPISESQTTLSPNKYKLNGATSGRKGCLFRESRETCKFSAGKIERLCVTIIVTYVRKL